MGPADALILLFAAAVDLLVFAVLRGRHRRHEMDQRVKRSIQTSVRYQRW